MHGELAELQDRHDSTNQSLTVAERDVLELSVRCEELTLESEALRSQCEEEISKAQQAQQAKHDACLLYTSPSPRDRQKSRMPSSA